MPSFKMELQRKEKELFTPTFQRIVFCCTNPQHGPGEKPLLVLEGANVDIHIKKQWFAIIAQNVHSYKVGCDKCLKRKGGMYSCGYLKVEYKLSPERAGSYPAEGTGSLEEFMRMSASLLGRRGEIVIESIDVYTYSNEGKLKKYYSFEGWWRVVNKERENTYENVSMKHKSKGYK